MGGVNGRKFWMGKAVDMFVVEFWNVASRLAAEVILL